MRHVIALILLSVGVSASAWAQTLGSIVGEVKDASGAVAPNVKVTAVNTGTNVSRETLTNTAGIYTFPALVPGNYTVKVEAAGFQLMQRSNIELQVQQTASIDFVLAIGQATQTVEVSGTAALLNTEDATVGTVIEQRRITDLPLNGRNFFSLVALSPNVTYGFTPAQQASGRLGGTRSTLTMSLSGARPHGRTTRSTASPTRMSTSTPTSCCRRSTRCRSSRYSPASIPRSSAGKRGR
jgi:hypothetical protein